MQKNSPTSLMLQAWRVVYSKISHIGTPAAHRRVLKWIPHKEVQRYRHIVETSESVSRMLWNEKKAALQQDNEAVVRQIGEGKDIISTLSQCKICMHLHMQADLNPPSESQPGRQRRGQTTGRRAYRSNGVNTILLM